MIDSRERTAEYAKSPAYEAIVARLNQLIGASAPPMGEPSRPLLFVIGPPRSGTTLLYQVLAASGGFGYVSNLIARFFARPAVGADVQALLAAFLPAGAPSFDSRAGATSEWSAPHEFGYFWQRFFPFTHDHEPSPEALARVDHRMLAAELALLETRLARPLVLKNPILAFVLPLLARALPTARFVAVERAPLEVAASLLRMRREYYDDERAWFSVRPRDAASWLELPPARQIALQLRSVLDAQATLASQLGAERFRTLSYDALCADPRGSTRELARWLGLDAGAQLSGLSAVPERFDVRSQPASTPAAHELQTELHAVGLEP